MAGADLPRKDARDSGLDRRRRVGRGHRAGARDGCGAEGRQRPPRHGDEPGAGGVPALPEGDAAQPRRPALAGSRPVRALRRALLTDALPAALPRWLGAGARRHQGAAHLGQQDPGAPGVRPHRRRGDHHRPAGPGHRQRGRHGDGRSPRAWPAGSQRGRGRLTVRPPDLRDLQRRRHGGGRQLRGVVDRGRAGPRQPHRHLRRQPDQHRGRHRHRAVRGRRRPLRGLRLARADGRLDPRRRHLPRGRPRAVRRAAQGPVGHRPSLVHRAEDDHRLARAERAEHRQGTRLRPRRRGGRGHQEGSRASTPT